MKLILHNTVTNTMYPCFIKFTLSLRSIIVPLPCKQIISNNNFSSFHRNEPPKPIKISFPINQETSDRKKSRATRVFCQAAGYQFPYSHWRRVVREERSSGKYERSRDSVPFALMMRTIRSKKRACGFLVYFAASSAMANWNRETLPSSMTFPETLQMK